MRYLISYKTGRLHLDIVCINTDDGVVYAVREYAPSGYNHALYDEYELARERFDEILSSWTLVKGEL